MIRPAVKRVLQHFFQPAASSLADENALLRQKVEMLQRHVRLLKARAKGTAHPYDELPDALPDALRWTCPRCGGHRGVMHCHDFDAKTGDPCRMVVRPATVNERGGQ